MLMCLKSFKGRLSTGYNSGGVYYVCGKAALLKKLVLLRGSLRLEKPNPGVARTIS